MKKWGRTVVRPHLRGFNLSDVEMDSRIHGNDQLLLFVLRKLGPHHPGRLASFRETAKSAFVQ